MLIYFCTFLENRPPWYLHAVASLNVHENALTEHLCVCARRWAASHLEPEAVGTVWGTTGEVRMATGSSCSVQRLPAHNARVHPREPRHSCRVSTAPLDQLITLSVFPVIQSFTAFVRSESFRSVWSHIHLSECKLTVKVKQTGHAVSWAQT